jgi:hypothetical protein
MGLVAIEPLNVSIHVTGDITLVFLPKSSCFRGLFRETLKLHYIVNVKGFYLMGNSNDL